MLIPDFQGNEAALYTVLDAGPDILNHNTETVPRLYRLARSGGRYARTLELLDRSRAYAPAIATKSGIMLGLGEEWDEVVATLARSAQGRLRHSHARPVPASVGRASADDPLLPSGRVPRLKEIALEMGFAHVESGPLVRSSYHAHEQAEALLAGSGQG